MGPIAMTKVAEASLSPLEDPLRMALRDTPWPSTGQFIACPVCGESWRPWCGSRLPCHAKCVLTEAAQDALLDEYGVTQAEQAALLGVSVPVIRASVAAALRRRGKEHARQ